MSSPDHQSNPMPTALPEPPSGIGAADLVTDSTDPQELRALLERARERLAFYESFDRIVGENLRRSGDLMVENVALREQVHALTAQSTRDRAAFEETRQADREGYRLLVQAALDKAASVQPVIDAMMGTLREALQRIDNPSEAPAPAGEPPSPAAATPALPEEPIPAQPDAPEPMPLDEEPATPPAPPEQAAPAPDPAATDAPAENEPRVIQVLAHRVPGAKIAIALQKMLKGLDGVSNVDAREFANGELRLAVTATRPLTGDALASWLADNAGTLTSSTDSVTEVTFNE